MVRGVDAAQHQLWPRWEVLGGAEGMGVQDAPPALSRFVTSFQARRLQTPCLLNNEMQMEGIAVPLLATRCRGRGIF